MSRFIGLAVLALGGVGMVGCLAGTIGIWLVRPSLLHSSGEIRDAADEGLKLVSEKITRADELLKRTRKRLKVMLNRSRPVIVYTSGYLEITDPKALEDLLRLCGHYESLRVFFNAQDRFHSKFFFFDKPDDAYSLFLGSSNVSVGGFADTGELNVHIRGKSTDAVCRDIKTVMANLEKNRDFEPLSDDAILAYRKRRGDKKPKRGPARKRSRFTLRLEEMPILVLDRDFSTKELRPEQKWRRGAILDHPYLARLRKDKAPLTGTG
jgi:HKD family nuclease